MQISTQDVSTKSILLLYSDGGPDHNTTYLSSKVAIIALHLMLNMDMTIHLRTAPHHSWKNMIERVFAGVNVGLQAVGLMRCQASPELESKLKNASNLTDLRKAVVDHEEEYAESHRPCKELLNSIIEVSIGTITNVTTLSSLMVVISDICSKCEYIASIFPMKQFNKNLNSH